MSAKLQQMYDVLHS